MVATLASCDDSKAVCKKMCAKMKECVPQQIDEATKKVPAGAGKMLEGLKEKMKKEFEKAAAECTKSCDEGGKVTAKDKKSIGKVKKCLDKPCGEYMKCMEAAMK